jgi:hypothetical protein
MIMKGYFGTTGHLAVVFQITVRIFTWAEPRNYSISSWIVSYRSRLPRVRAGAEVLLK